MSEAQLFGILYFGGIALVFSLTLVVMQAAFIDLASRFGRHLMPWVPAIALGAGAIAVALSKRSLEFDAFSGGENALGDPSSSWINRIGNAILLAIALGKIAQALFANRDRRPLWTYSAEQHANRRLFIAFLTFCVCSLILPMVLSDHPAFEHDGLVAAPMFIAAYLSRGERLDGVIAAAKWTLVLIIVGSLGVAVVRPQLAVESHYLTGWIPGLQSRLWGLASHANHMGGLALYLILLLALQPMQRRWMGALAWLLALTALMLTQSKTSWFAALLAGGAIGLYRHGRDGRGRLRVETVVLMLLGVSAVAIGFQFVDATKLIDRFLDSDAGAGLTSLTGRTRIWAEAIRMWLDSPMFGYGPEAWAPLHRMQMGVPTATQAHNQLLESLAIGGLASAVPMVVYFAMLGGAAVRAADRTRGVSLGFFLVFAVRSLSETPLGIGNLVGGDVVIQLLLFMLVINEAGELQSAPAPKLADVPTTAGLIRRRAQPGHGRI
ncbi:MAG: O-antigen ligase family protein [Burkholderiaceae bacterium]|nr:O-antigen ligase family protein [Roseateles sp.]MBV8469804.1 O-antigen ligase family protein [Burkholderiaceae bacterium]